ncbi:MAG TPA: helicase C-terminal domain-containing protein [bacterium]
MKDRLHLSVRNLVEYSLRSGDLDLTTFGTLPGVDAVYLHNKIQRSRGAESQYEVPVRHDIERDNYVLMISGRIDSLSVTNGAVVIEEVKTTARDLRRLEETDNPFHWGQVKCYAYIYALQHNLMTITIQLTYYSTETREIRELRRTAGVNDLKVFFESLVLNYTAWADRTSAWIDTRDASIQALRFPFAGFRPGQETMIDRVAETVSANGQLLIHAPTGIGKTVAVMLPALQALAAGSIARVFYLTARTTGRAAAESTLDVLRQQGLRLKSLSLVAKEKVCFNPDKVCNGAECAYARGFYDRLKSAAGDALESDALTREHVLTLAKKHDLCPFEFALELSLWVDILICDYNYVFDPRVYLRRFFAEGQDDCIFLVDEAHNLVDRGREMFSSELSKGSVLAVKRALHGQLPAVTRSLTRINTWLRSVKKRCVEQQGAFAEKDKPEKLCALLGDFTDRSEQWLVLNQPAIFRQEFIEFYFEAKAFLKIAQRYDETYATCFSAPGRDVSVKLLCVDPARHLAEGLQRGLSAIFFSGTLTPTEYFVTSFGCHDDAESLVLPSPFPAEQLCVLIASRISALYKHRDWTKHQVVAAISAMIEQKKGNYLVFFPSYQYMHMVHTIFAQEHASIKTLVQLPNMTEHERERFITQFSHEPVDHLIGFAVMGGVFSESIDLMGDRLAGAAIIGVGMPQLSLEREIIKEYYDQKDSSGFAFAYQVPGMVRVLQAAGRVIRSETDQGVVLLIDTRYAGEPYRSMMPDEWQPKSVSSVADIEMIIKGFWHQ